MLASAARMFSGSGRTARLIGLPEPDYPFLVHYDDGAIAAAALLVVKLVSLGGRSLGMEVRKLGVGQPAHSRGPGAVSGNGVATDAQYLGILLLEPAVVLPEEGSLSRSTGCEVEHMEGKHHALFALILA